MAATAYLTQQRTDWRSVAAEVSRRLGKAYPGQYVREIASGWRGHKTIVPILVEMGLMTSPISAPAPDAPRLRRQGGTA
jgi:hypothetical protein